MSENGVSDLLDLLLAALRGYTIDEADRSDPSHVAWVGACYRLADRLRESADGWRRDLVEIDEGRSERSVVRTVEAIAIDQRLRETYTPETLATVGVVLADHSAEHLVDLLDEE